MPDVLLIDGSAVTGTVALHDPRDPAAPGIRLALDAVSAFDVNVRGQYLARSRESGWVAGSVHRRGDEIPVEAPEGAAEGAISPDGARILWTVRSGGRSLLVVSDPTGSTGVDLVDEEGALRAPAWGPESRRIAYYFGGPEALAEDGFRLMLVDADETPAGPTELAPPSRPIGMTPERTRPPAFSPDGTRILFVANYEPDERIRPEGYVVPVRGGAPERVLGGSWSARGDRLLCVCERGSPDSLGLCVQRLPGGQIEDVLPDEELPLAAYGGRWNPDASFFAYIAGDDALWVIDVAAGTRTRVGAFKSGARLSWID